MLFELKKIICSLEHHAAIGKLSTSKKEILEKDTKKLLRLINKVSKKQLSNKKQFVIKYQTVIDYIHKIILKYISKEYLLLRKEILKFNLDSTTKHRKLPTISSSFFTNTKANCDIN